MFFYTITFCFFAGSKQGSLTFDGCLKNEEDSCPNIGPSNFLVGRTEYTIMMYDSKTPGRKWNISYFDYTSNMATAETQSDYSKYFFLIYGISWQHSSLLRTSGLSAISTCNS